MYAEGLPTPELWEDGRRDNVSIRPATLQFRHDGEFVLLPIVRLNQFSVVSTDRVDHPVGQTQRSGRVLEPTQVDKLLRGRVEPHQLRDVLAHEVDALIEGNGAVDADFERPRHLQHRPGLRHSRHKVLDVVLDDKQLVPTHGRRGRENGLDQVGHAAPFTCRQHGEFRHKHVTHVLHYKDSVYNHAMPCHQGLLTTSVPLADRPVETWNFQLLR